MIEIDVAARSISLLVDEAVLTKRQDKLVSPPPAGDRGWLSVFQRLAKPIYKGATLTPD